MPTYDYVCPDHPEEHVEIVCRMTEYGSIEVPKCPKCEKLMERLIRCAGFVLAGEGWYRDGYK